MASESAPAPAVAPLSVADKLEMSLEEIAKRDKQARFEKLKEERKQKRAEAAAKKKAEAAAAPKKEAGANKKEGGANKGNKQEQKGKQIEKGKAGDKKGNGKNEPAAKEKPPLTTGTLVLVTNLDAGVDAPALKDILEAVGPVKSIELLPGRGNKPPAAKVFFKTKADAEKAVAEFNDRLLDGKKIQVRIQQKRVLTTTDKQQQDTSGQENRKRQRRSN